MKEYNNMELNLFAIYSKNRIEWNLLDISCVLFNFASIPIYDTLGPKAIPFILNQSNVTTIFLTKDVITGFLELTDFGKIKNVVCFDELD